MRRIHLRQTLGLAAVLASALTLSARDNSAAEYNSTVRATPLLRTTTDVAGNPLAYPTGGAAEVSGLLVELPPGAETGWHKHTVPCFAYILSGEIAVAQKSGPTRTFRAGDAFAELVNIEHNGHTLGSEPVRIVFFAAGVQGQTFTVKSAAEPAKH
ncbi:MAG TPA: cupin domain-containing protein [Opitutaceae bacterium]|nr:cupin domain-containing protein [Opitutaceae bacterium]